jgi:peptide chain release factor 2
VRVTHLPTGATADSRSERSQHKNDQTAFKLLKAKLVLLQQDRLRPPADRRRLDNGEIDWKTEVRSYVLHPYTRVSDRPTGKKVVEAHRVLDGAIDLFLRPKSWTGQK